MQFEAERAHSESRRFAQDAHVTVAPGLHPLASPRLSESVAEEVVYAALRKGLPKGWYAWHSLRIRTGDGLLGEGDFVIVDPQRGMLVLEVKGGQTEQRDGRWLQNSRPMDQAPLEQALRFQRTRAEGCPLLADADGEKVPQP